MKKRLLKNTLVSLVILFNFAGIALAGDSVSLSVSCTIPSIPGVNAPPFETTANADIQENSKILLVEQTANSETVQTIYSR